MNLLQISISNVQGDTLLSVPVSAEPSQLEIQSLLWDKNSTQPELAISTVLGQKVLYIFDMKKSRTPIELNFPTKYGSIVSYGWCKDDKVSVLFSSGAFIVMSGKYNLTN